jgi:tRNA(fMet)-specific endonuclease VapC
MKSLNFNDPVLIDTDVLSYLHNEYSLANAYRNLLVNRQAFVSLQTIAEMKHGSMLKSWGTKRVLHLENFLTYYTLLLPNEKTAMLWAQLRTQVRNVGRHIKPDDAWIAATALEHDLVMVTHNVKDFESVEGLQILSLNPKNTTNIRP